MFIFAQPAVQTATWS